MAEVITPEMLAPNASPKIKEFGLSFLNEIHNVPSHDASDTRQ